MFVLSMALSLQMLINLSLKLRLINESLSMTNYSYYLLITHWAALYHLIRIFFSDVQFSFLGRSILDRNAIILNLDPGEITIIRSRQIALDLLEGANVLIFLHPISTATACGLWGPPSVGVSVWLQYVAVHANDGGWAHCLLTSKEAVASRWGSRIWILQ